MPRLRLRFFVMSVLPLVAAGTTLADAQESRAAIIAAQQAEKAAKLTPYVPGAAERTVVKLEREFLQDPNGFYPLFASVYSGGGFTLGARLPQVLRRPHARGPEGPVLDQELQAVRGQHRFVGPLPTDAWICTRGSGWRDATQVAFHGVGMDTPVDAANYRMKQAYAGGDVSCAPVRWVVAGAGLSFEDFTLEQGTGRPPVDRSGVHAR